MIRKLFITAVLASATFGAAAQTDISKVNGGVRAESGREYGEIETVNGGVRVESQARVRTVSTVNGGVRVDDGAAIGSVETVNGGITFGEGVVVERDAETVNGGIELGRATRVDGKVSTVNGRINLEEAEIGDGIETVNGDIDVGEGSTVHGGILVEKPTGNWLNWGGKSRDPRIVIGANAVVEGDLVFKRDVELFVHETATIGRVEGATAKRFSGSSPD